MKLKNFMSHVVRRFVSYFAVVLMLSAILPGMVANATYDMVDEENGIVDVIADLSYFYRLPFDYYGNSLSTTDGDLDDGNTFIYGYGYGYNTSTGVYSYGYGYGYGYGYFRDHGDGWVAGDADLGFFLGTSGGTPTSATLPVTAAGVATSPIATTYAATGLSNVSILLPADLTLTGSAGWNGALTITGTSTYASTSTAVQALLDSGSAIASVTVDTGLSVAVTLSDEIIVKIPIDLSGVTSPVVAITNGAGETSTEGVCTTGEYTGVSTSDAQLTDADYYSVAASSACYVIGTGDVAGYTYVATRHLTTFAAGAAAVSTTPAPTGGSPLGGRSGGSSGDDDDEEDEELTEEEVVMEQIAEGEVKIEEVFSDLAGVPESDWRYQVIQQVASTGLFKGETGSDGKKVFNMTGGMNRAMAAEVVSRYVGCNVVAVTNSPFEDVPVNEWYTPGLTCLKNLGVVSGKTPTTYAPGDLVTRAEFSKLMIEGYIANNPIVETPWRLMMSAPATAFADVSTGDWYSGYLNLAYNNGLLEGYIDGGKRYAKGNNTVIRIEAAAIVTNFLGSIGEEVTEEVEDEVEEAVGELEGEVVDGEGEEVTGEEEVAVEGEEGEGEEVTEEGTEAGDGEELTEDGGTEGEGEGTE